MITINKIKNIYRFLYIFSDNKNSTEDYYIEKVEQILRKNFEINKTIPVCEYFIKSYSFKPVKSEIINNVYSLFDKAYFYIDIQRTLKYFKKYIGNPKTVKEEQILVNPKIEMAIKNIIFKSSTNKTFIKNTLLLQKIRTIKKAD